MATSEDNDAKRGAMALEEDASNPFIRAPGTEATTTASDARVLVVAGDRADLARLAAHLGGVRFVRCTVEHAGIDDALTRLAERAFDACLVAEGNGSGVGFLRHARAADISVPLLLLSARPDVALEVEAMALGAADVVDEQHLDGVLLGRTIRHAIIRRRQAQNLIRLARQDELTGLANRSLLQDRLERALAFARRNDRMLAVMILDLNGFKRINDEFGHAMGDRLLCVTAERLRGRLRETDTIARTGGDEFALVIENLARPEHAALVAQKLLDAVAPPFVMGQRRMVLSASLGVALYPRDSQSPSDLQRLADAAMYRAKMEGGNVYRFASPQLERSVQRGALLASDLRRAIERGEFALHFQPQVTLAPTRLGLAALPVWAHPELGMIAADRFIGLADTANLSEALMDWLIDAALDQLSAWRGFGLERLHVALPLIARRQLAWSDLADRLSGRIYRAAVPAQSIEIEVDESRLLADLEGGADGVRRLRATGIRLALDAYGAGSTSLKAFENGVIDTVKLDHALLHEVPSDRHRAAVLRAILELTARLEIRTVALGAHRHEQVAFLRRHGCTAVQAFMSCPSLPADACARWLDQAAARRDRPPVQQPQPA